MSGAFGIYVHWPFCLSKCPYCDFNSHVATSIDQTGWRNALLTELAFFAGETTGRQVTSVFFGGGTPSLMAPSTTDALLSAIAGHWSMAEDVEITLEANPGTIDAASFHAFRAAGVNRLSMGLQALDDSSLRFLGRRHDVAQAIAAVDLARSIFPRISFDLIYARPGQTPADWELELRRAIDLAADHLSLYQLTIEAGTAFHPAHARGDFILPDEDASAEMFDLTQTLATAHGLPAYEISNHARPGAECRHNLVYWQGDDYLGIGPGAHGRLTDRSGVVWAQNQHRAPETWLSAVGKFSHGTREKTALTAEERIAELVMMGLRLNDGLSADRFRRQTGRDLRSALNRSGLDMMCTEGFLSWTDTHLQATHKGRLVLNSVIGALLT
ncbi:MAG TPA: radical SAM family heme chaperone HemW [Telmatospirillum sp.]|nr:radical SAM family heme chaperone HemW [Telmatospirillum sp.]